VVPPEIQNFLHLARRQTRFPVTEEFRRAILGKSLFRPQLKDGFSTFSLGIFTGHPLSANAKSAYWFFS
jgi:hypothetical protein